MPLAPLDITVCVPGRGHRKSGQRQRTTFFFQIFWGIYIYFFFFFFFKEKLPFLRKISLTLVDHWPELSCGHLCYKEICKCDLFSNRAGGHSLKVVILEDRVKIALSATATKLVLANWFLSVVCPVAKVCLQICKAIVCILWKFFRIYYVMQTCGFESHCKPKTTWLDIFCDMLTGPPCLYLI